MPNNLAYLEDRSVVAGEQEHRVNAGVKQGWLLGLLLWNLAYEGELELANLPGRVKTSSHADDLVVIVKARTEITVQGRTEGALDKVMQWMDRNHLKLSQDEAEALYLTGRKRTKE